MFTSTHHHLLVKLPINSSLLPTTSATATHHRHHLNPLSHRQLILYLLI